MSNSPWQSSTSTWRQPRTPRRAATSGASVDPGRWPDIAALPRCSRARAAGAELVTARAFARLPIRVRFPSGEVRGSAGPLVIVHDPQACYRRLGADGLVGIGESYMAREWDTQSSGDLVAVFTLLAERAATLLPDGVQRLLRLFIPRTPANRRNTPEVARANTSSHYDLSNDLFALFLDPTMTYSSAVFDQFPANWSTFAQAQQRKIDLLLDRAAVGAGTRLLEIGTGWGELALRAAARGAQVLSVTLSKEQLELARRRVRDAGLSNMVTVELRDFREVRGSFDAVVSVEMIEAVGREFWPEYFRRLEGALAPRGRIALQAITMPHRRMLASRRTYTWIDKYIFPGGQMPSVEALEQAAAGHTRLRTVERESFGAHYAETLRLWREQFCARQEDVDALGFDETFRRMWTLYLAYSEAGFLSRYLDVQQMLLMRGEGR
ncbi:class I SAM-dependent methyltransferase [Streptomyces sp. NPDC002403]